jgi:hypothetical protein
VHVVAHPACGDQLVVGEVVELDAADQDLVEHVQGLRETTPRHARRIELREMVQRPQLDGRRDPRRRESEAGRGSVLVLLVGARHLVHQQPGPFVVSGDDRRRVLRQHLDDQPRQRRLGMEVPAGRFEPHRPRLARDAQHRREAPDLDRDRGTRARVTSDGELVVDPGVDLVVPGRRPEPLGPTCRTLGVPGHDGHDLVQGGEHGVVVVAYGVDPGPDAVDSGPGAGLEDAEHDGRLRVHEQLWCDEDGTRVAGRAGTPLQVLPLLVRLVRRQSALAVGQHLAVPYQHADLADPRRLGHGTPLGR